MPILNFLFYNTNEIDFGFWIGEQLAEQGQPLTLFLNWLLWKKRLMRLCFGWN